MPEEGHGGHLGSRGIGFLGLQLTAVEVGLFEVDFEVFRVQGTLVLRRGNWRREHVTLEHDVEDLTDEN